MPLTTCCTDALRLACLSVAIAAQIAALSGAFTNPVLAQSPAEKKEQIHKALLQIYLSQRRKEAAGEFNAIIALNPSDAQTHYEYGKWLAGGDQLKASVAQFQAATKLQPRNALFNAGLGSAYLHLGQYGNAVAAYTKAQQCCNPGQDFRRELQVAQQYLQNEKAMAKYKQQVKDQD